MVDQPRAAEGANCKIARAGMNKHSFFVRVAPVCTLRIRLASTALASTAYEKLELLRVSFLLNRAFNCLSCMMVYELSLYEIIEQNN